MYLFENDNRDRCYEKIIQYGFVVIDKINKIYKNYYLIYPFILI